MRLTFCFSRSWRPKSLVREPLVRPLGVELGLVRQRATGALEEQVGAFTAGEFGLGAEKSCHVNVLFSI
jgi:hypothetical protein